MSKKVRVCTAVLTMLLFCGITLAQAPVLDINASVHPDLAQAQRLVAEANKYIEKAQVANKGDMQGHAEKARRLLAEANRELAAAAEAANAANAAKQKRKR